MGKEVRRGGTEEEEKGKTRMYGVRRKGRERKEGRRKIKEKRA